MREYKIYNSEIDDSLDGGFIPIMAGEDSLETDTKDIPTALPILSLRDTVLFPGAIIPISIGREKSIKLVKDNYKKNKLIGVVAQKQADTDDPKPEDLYTIGTFAYIVKTLQLRDGNTTALIKGSGRFEITNFIQEEPYILAEVKPFNDVNKRRKNNQKFNAIVDIIKDLAIEIVEKVGGSAEHDKIFALKNIETPMLLISYVASNLSVSTQEKQRILSINDIDERAKVIVELLSRELQLVDLKNQIQSKVKHEIDKQQRDYVLNQQLKLIQDELGSNPNEDQINQLKQKAKSKKWPKNAYAVFEKELSKLSRINPMSTEYSMQLNYVDILADLPWETYTQDNFDLERARKILDEDHFGMEKIKERILEYLAVLKLKGDMKSPILCLVGPPGVGKTSLGKSIARAVNRNYVRVSLGGLHDESEIRGHRRTYIGAMPGRIIQSIRKAKTSNPVFVLDEIDKVSGMNVNGDPSAALLEVLDPEQNTAFYDNFVEVEYDLSKVMFIATANSLSNIHPALRDRMEVIELSGYLVEEKIEIAKRHLIPKQLKEHGVKKSDISFPKATLTQIIENYTLESGVRTLDKTIAKIVRNRALQIVADKPYTKSINKNQLNEILGKPLFNYATSYSGKSYGVATGLAWTPVGGQILFIETALNKGKAGLTLTGNLGDVMKESAIIALEYLKSKANELKIPVELFAENSVHIHVPEGATPKDGPSAGITMFTSLVSAFLKKPVNPKYAMSGEITLRGRILPVGGVKEKILAAKRSGVTDIILCSDNKKDVDEINPKYIEGLNFHYLENMLDVVKIALQ
ncbi:MAG: endopeptidase La [Lentimicrobiaceae bacterium]|nr:endopeptidase La [Lentimicrobiaceae bacterium]